MWLDIPETAFPFIPKSHLCMYHKMEPNSQGAKSFDTA